VNDLTKRVGLFVFTNDLRLHDNPALVRVCMTLDELVCVFVKQNAWCQTSKTMNLPYGKSRRQFENQSLADLSVSLENLGQRLIVREGSLYQELGALIEELSPSDIFHSAQISWYERRSWNRLNRRYPGCQFHSIPTFTLFDSDNLPFALDNFPKGFSEFRKAAENKHPLSPLKKVSYLPPMPSDMAGIQPSHILGEQIESESLFQGGESAALSHLRRYFESEHPLTYKETRNSLDGWTNSCKFSPWLANGSLSVRKIAFELDNFERREQANDSTYWILFELLWREYFQWFALKHSARIFMFSGVAGKRPLTSYYGERYIKWVQGKTPYPIVNASMQELAETGLMSNRA